MPIIILHIMWDGRKRDTLLLEKNIKLIFLKGLKVNFYNIIYIFVFISVILEYHLSPLAFNCYIKYCALFGSF